MTKRRVQFDFKYINGWYRVYAIHHTGGKTHFGTVWQGETGKWFGSLPCSRTPDVMGNSFTDCRDKLWALANGG